MRTITLDIRGAVATAEKAQTTSVTADDRMFLDALKKYFLAQDIKELSEWKAQHK